MLYSTNPYSQALIAEYPEHSLFELDSITSNSANAFSSWKNTTLPERIALFQKLSELLLADKLSLAKLITAEMGKPLKEAEGEIEKCTKSILYYCQHTEKILAPTIINTEASNSFVVYEPLGTILALMPWNFPFWQVFRCAVPAMMAGNTVILKLSPNTTGCALAMEALFLKAGFPLNCFQAVKIQNETTSYLIQKKEIRAISLTGSERVGMIVAAEAGKQLKKLVLELGGSDPFIVLADADISHAVDMAIISGLQNAGQSCIAAKRFILNKKIATEFIETLILQLSNLKIGDPMDPLVDIGPMAKMDLKIGLTAQVNKSIEMGATLRYGTINENNDLFFTPIILTKVAAGMPAFEEELFGPVFSIIEIASEEEAITMANSSPYGLGASIWTSNNEKAQALALKLECGMVFINELVHSDVRLPFGGTKLSGYGRELSDSGMKEFVNLKTIYVK